VLQWAPEILCTNQETDKTVSMEKFKSANSLLLFGGFFLVMAVIQAYTGRAWARGLPTYHRDKNPKGFWWTVGMYVLFGAFCIGYSLYSVGKN
jgi:hypothetical protein